MKEVFAPIVFVLSFMMLWVSCFDETIVDAVQTDIGTSVDTMRFDTVFTTIGSATRQFKIYNRSTENVMLDRVALAESDSKFRINVDGISGNQIEDIFIKAQDSIYVFVEVTVDPDAPLSESPFVITEDLIISGVDGDVHVTLEAWGQNANYYPTKDAKGQLIRLTCDNQTIVWDDPKPYVVYGLLFVDSCGLVIPAGAKVHFHGGLGIIDGQIYNDGGLIIMKDGSINSLGTLDRPVIMQGDRLEVDFAETSGQWAGIRILPESQNNLIENTTIKNSVVGLRVDSAAHLTVRQSIIANTSNVGLIGLNSTISVDNSLIYNNGGQSALLASGGDYTLRHVTMGNYGNQSAALYMDNFDCLDPDCNNILVLPLKADIQNCIMAGSNRDELNLTDVTNGDLPEAWDVSIQNSYIRVDELNASYPVESYCTDCIEYDQQESLFRDIDMGDYRLDSSSVAIDQGQLIEELRVDINGSARDQQPDLGCYELQ